MTIKTPTAATQYQPNKAPLHLATRTQLAEKKLIPTADPEGYIITKNGKTIFLYNWLHTKHSRNI